MIKMVNYDATQYNLRLAHSSDTEMIWSWRNHPDVRQWMFHQEYISLEKHKIWFNQQLQNHKNIFLIFLISNKPSGLVTLNQLNDANVYEWGFYRAPESPPGTGIIMGQLALKYAFIVTQAHKIFGQVLSYNQKSYQFHKTLGFQVEGQLKQHVKIKSKFFDVWQFGLLADQYRERL